MMLPEVWRHYGDLMLLSRNQLVLQVLVLKTGGLNPPTQENTAFKLLDSVNLASDELLIDKC